MRTTGMAEGREGGIVGHTVKVPSPTFPAIQIPTTEAITLILFSLIFPEYSSAILANIYI